MTSSVAVASSSRGHRQFVERPAKKQFCSHQGADAGHRLCHASAIEAAVVAQQAGEHRWQGKQVHRWQGKQVQDIVAKIGQQGCLFFAYPDQISQRISETFDDGQSLGVGHDWLRRKSAGDGCRRVRGLSGERLVVLDHPQQGVLVGGVFGCRQQCEGDQVDRIEHGRLVDPFGEFGGRVARGGARP